jgi:hypothetical protein
VLLDEAEVRRRKLKAMRDAEKLMYQLAKELWPETYTYVGGTEDKEDTNNE